MCAEAVPWRCHRSLIADALLARGIEVREIRNVNRTQVHSLTPWRQVNEDQVTYPAEHSGRHLRHPEDQLIHEQSEHQSGEEL